MVVKKLTLIFLIELNMVISPSQREVVYKVRNAYKVYWVVKRINAQMREQSHNTVLQGLHL